MICPERHVLMTWCDGEIASPEAEIISEHIKHCDSCRTFTAAQKQMESVWRDAWTDPDQASFDEMRSSVKEATPWWRTQRTWFIAAALCAAYIGVKIFYIDGTGTSLSSIALEETTAPVQATTGDIPAARYDTPVDGVEEVAAAECVEEETEILEDELASGQSETFEVIEELSVDLSLSVSDSGAPEEDIAMETVRDADLISGYTEVVLNAVEGQHFMDSEDMADPPGTTDEGFEQEELYRAATACLPESAGSGILEGEVSGGVGGGGGIAYVSAGTTSAKDQSDDSIVDIQSLLSAQSETGMAAYSVSITLESKEIIQIQRSQWDSLFSMIDTLVEDNWNCSVEIFVFTVSSEGIISGDDVADGTVIAIPEAGYGDCTVTVHCF